MKNINATLRKRTLPSGKVTLYLDFFPEPKKPAERWHNLEILHKAEIIRAARFNELNKQQIYTAFELERIRRCSFTPRSTKNVFLLPAGSKRD